ncbi:hypothetical protein FQR65_LT13524 [Abscondita terminalis]|nr:hypothetical protein FQR65_LT13524 [Abscondita terminalis]
MKVGSMIICFIVIYSHQYALTFGAVVIDVSNFEEYIENPVPKNISETESEPVISRPLMLFFVHRNLLVTLSCSVLIGMMYYVYNYCQMPRT